MPDQIEIASNPILIATWADVKYFKPFEFDSPDARGSGEKNMNLEFVLKLDTMRDLIKRPLYITSGYRTSEYNKIVGGVENSAHLKGLAVDIRVLDSNLRFLIMYYAMQLGVRRIEDAAAHIHLDLDKTLPQDVLIHSKER